MQSLHNQTASELPAILSPRNVAANGVVEISYPAQVFLLLSLVVIVAVSQCLHMNIEKQLTIGAIRCFVQLSALGLILVPIIMWNKPILVLMYIILMMFVAALEASSRPPYVFDSIVLVCFVAISGTVVVFGTFTFAVVIRTGLDAQYAIPITGMITGTSLSAVSVAVSNIVTTVAERKESIELLLAFGGTRWEAGLQCVRSSVILGLTPILNMLSVTGLVQIPGMMTGQIIGGTPPSLAAKYQLVIMYVAAGTATVATVLASVSTLYVLIDSQHRIRSEKLMPRQDVNRLDAIIASAKCLATNFLSWRHRSLRQRSPFPSHVNEPLPCPTNPADHLTKTGCQYGSDYGATSRGNAGNAND